MRLTLQHMSPDTGAVQDHRGTRPRTAAPTHERTRAHKSLFFFVAHTHTQPHDTGARAHVHTRAHQSTHSPIAHTHTHTHTHTHHLTTQVHRAHVRVHSMHTCTRAAQANKTPCTSRAQAGGNVVRLVGLYHTHRGAHTYFMRAKEVQRPGSYVVNLLHYEDAARLATSVSVCACVCVRVGLFARACFCVCACMFLRVLPLTIFASTRML